MLPEDNEGCRRSESTKIIFIKHWLVSNSTLAEDMITLCIGSYRQRPKAEHYEYLSSEEIINAVDPIVNAVNCTTGINNDCYQRIMKVTHDYAHMNIRPLYTDEDALKHKDELPQMYVDSIGTKNEHPMSLIEYIGMFKYKIENNEEVNETIFTFITDSLIYKKFLIETGEKYINMKLVVNANEENNDEYILLRQELIRLSGIPMFRSTALKGHVLDTSKKYSTTRHLRDFMLENGLLTASEDGEYEDRDIFNAVQDTLVSVDLMIKSVDKVQKFICKSYASYVKYDLHPFI